MGTDSVSLLRMRSKKELLALAAPDVLRILESIAHGAKGQLTV
jgi:hypothetical protein